MPKLFHLVVAGRTVDFVDDQNHIRSLKLDAAAMDEARVPAFCLQKIPLNIRLPRLNRDLRPARPSKRSGGSPLIQPIDPDGIVRGSAPKPVAPFGIANVGVGSRIDQYFVITGADNEAECVRMAMAGAPRPEGTGVNDRLRVSRNHDSNAGVGEKPRFPLPFPGLTPQYAGAEPPGRLL